MSYRLLLSSLAACAALSTVAMSADTPPTQTFDEVKARHLAHLQKEITCVEAAATFEEMHACMPPPPGGHLGPPPPHN